MNKHKPKIAVLFGGCSPEYGISLKSAYNVITHIDTAGYDIVPLGITQAGQWFLFDGDADKILEDTWHNPSDCTRAIISPDRDDRGVLVFTKNGVRTITLDAAMPVLHGKNGEDGTVQGLLELAGIPIVGCNTATSALCMDKYKTHRIVKAHGIRAASSFVLTNTAYIPAYIDKAEELGYPLFVKPVRAGSSHGITKAACKNQLTDAISLAFQYDDQVIIEENIDGIEVGCAILGNDDLIVGCVDEIELAKGFFDYHEKYTLETSAIHVPARISAQKAWEIKETAKIIYKVLGCTGFARVDMFLTPAGEIFLNEVNTIPGFTMGSRFPNMLKTLGMNFEEIVGKIIELTVAP